MKVLFAVNNEEISESIIKRYQKNYKEIISCKNVYYFNAILKELQKDKSYDRIVISEELEAFTHTQYEQIDKFIFDKLDSISDEAANTKGTDIPIILICSDRRTKSEQILVKLFGIGIYNALLGNDRSIENVCKLINKPRAKKEAKQYYKIDSLEVDYKPENENEVSEIEIQNILAHYKRLGKDERKYVESFNNIVAQYNDIQLKIIINYLPLNVKAVLEENSPKYQELTAFSKSASEEAKKVIKEPKGTTEKFLKSMREKKNGSPVIIPSAVNKEGTKKVSKVSRKEINTEQTIKPNNNLSDGQIVKPNNRGGQIVRSNNNQENRRIEPQQINRQKEVVQKEVNQNRKEDILPEIEVIPSIEDRKQPVEGIKVAQEPKRQEEIPTDINKEITNEKRGRGRPKKIKNEEENLVEKPKRKRGRPSKKPLVSEEKETNIDDIIEPILPGFEEFDEETNSSNIKQDKTDIILPGFDDIIDDNDADNGELDVLPGTDQYDEDTNMQSNDSEEEVFLPGFDEQENEEDTYITNDDNFEDEPVSTMNEDIEDEPILPMIGETEDYQTNNQDNSYQNYQYTPTANNELNYMEKKENNKVYPDIDITNLLTPDKKVAIFVGTSKNGTSFLINSLAELTSSMGIDTAILDTTQNRNAYYIYTNNEEGLRNTALNSIEYLIQGEARGIRVNNNLTVYSPVPNEETEIENVGAILETLVKNHSLILIDSDFKTPSEYFRKSQEIYLVQSYDILTIQALTEFLKGLKYKNILDERKIRVILNKTVRIKSVSENLIIGGMANYNDPTMSTMIDLFNKNQVNYINIPFDEEAYARYLEGIINCNISIKKYSKNFLQVLKELSNMVYPTVSGKSSYKPPQVENNTFSASINSTLDQMKNKY